MAKLAARAAEERGRGGLSVTKHTRLFAAQLHRTLACCWYTMSRVHDVVVPANLSCSRSNKVSGLLVVAMVCACVSYELMGMGDRPRWYTYFSHQSVT